MIVIQWKYISMVWWCKIKFMMPQNLHFEPFSLSSKWPIQMPFDFAFEHWQIIRMPPCASICASLTQCNQCLFAVALLPFAKMVNYTKIFCSITANAFALYAGAILTFHSVWLDTISPFCKSAKVGEGGVEERRNWRKEVTSHTRLASLPNR